ncbi:MAG: hypothetical protein N3G21_02655 [Candidatus Hydrogenedentes bacterium]|nr:hypothetical protein [Candidatus Hydrogenedentota bacterium]
MNRNSEEMECTIRTQQKTDFSSKRKGINKDDPTHSVRSLYMQRSGEGKKKLHIT